MGGGCGERKWVSDVSEQVNLGKRVHQVVSEPTRGDALLDIYLLKPGNALISCNVQSGISGHKGVLLEVEWSDNNRDENTGSIVRCSTDQMY